jgi:hypothetical protein
MMAVMFLDSRCSADSCVLIASMIRSPICQH